MARIQEATLIRGGSYERLRLRCYRTQCNASSGWRKGIPNNSWYCSGRMFSLRRFRSEHRAWINREEVPACCSYTVREVEPGKLAEEFLGFRIPDACGLL